MVQITITVATNTATPEELTAVTKFLADLKAQPEEVETPNSEEQPGGAKSEQEHEPAKKPAPKKTRSRKSSSSKKEPAKTEDEEKSEPAKTEDEEKPEPAKEENSPEPEVTLDGMRKLLRVKSSEHRPAIKKKLSDLGAKSLSTLDKEHYQTMSGFLKSL